VDEGRRKEIVHVCGDGMSRGVPEETGVVWKSVVWDCAVVVCVGGKAKNVQTARPH
jgi:hypothetical protein